MDLTKTQAFVVFLFGLAIIGTSTVIAQLKGHNGVMYGASMAAIAGIVGLAIGRGWKKGGVK